MPVYKTSQIAVITLLCMIFLILFNSSCASHQKQKAAEKFDQTIRSYGRMLRWEELDGAVQNIQHEDGTPVDIKLDALKGLQIVNYELVSVAMSEDQKSAVVVAEISYYFETKNTVNTIRDTQKWWYSEEGKRWFMDGNLPAF